jgi:hypothetical protein
MFRMLAPIGILIMAVVAIPFLLPAELLIVVGRGARCLMPEMESEG